MAGTETGTGEFKKRNLVILGAVIGFLYGFGFRILANSPSSHLAVMTMGFTCFMPFAMGCITVYFAEIGQPRRLWTWIWLPWVPLLAALGATMLALDRKSTRLNSSHVAISYAVFCLKKKKL